MSSNYTLAYSILYCAILIAGVGVLILGALRAVQTSRGLVDPTYGNRARWGAAVASVIAIVVLISGIETVTGFSPSTIEAAELGFADFAAAFIVLFAFADSTVLVTIQSDFFHRSDLRWTRARRPAWVAILGCAAIDVALGGYTPFFAVFVLVAITCVGYVATALVVGARRTQDKTLKRHIRLLGWAIVLLLPSVLLNLVSNYGDVDLLVSVAGFDVAFYFFYRALMSLTPLGRVEEVGAPPTPVQVGEPR